jgi:hypothetical protein
MSCLNEKVPLEGAAGGENTSRQKEDAFWEREGMNDYGSIVDAAGCEKLWVSVDLESPNDLYHLARLLGRWNMPEGWHSAFGRCSMLKSAGRSWTGGTTCVGALGREKGAGMHATSFWAASPTPKL